MYLKIEERFKQESKLRMSQILFALFLISSYMLYVGLLYDWILNNYLFALVAFTFAFYLIVYLFVVFYLKVSNNRFSLKTFWNIPKVIEMYKQKSKDEIVELMLEKYKNDKTIDKNEIRDKVISKGNGLFTKEGNGDFIIENIRCKW